MSARILILIAFIVFHLGCEDVIDVQLETAEASLVVDGWINNLNEPQMITLSLSQAYFDNSRPPAVTDATVNITRDDGALFEFTHNEDGRYVWEPIQDILGQPGNSFALNIEYDGHTYSSVVEMHRVPVIDSIGIEFRMDEIFSDDGLYAQFYARDFQGFGDTYWIKTYKNDSYLSKTQELNIAFDAGFDAGTGIDGLVFIPPIRELVNPLSEDLLPTPYNEGDIIRIEIHSISNDAFNFLEIARDQINNGDNGIFSIPLANTKSNIKSSGPAVLGFFNVAAVSSAEREVN